MSYIFHLFTTLCYAVASTLCLPYIFCGILPLYLGGLLAIHACFRTSINSSRSSKRGVIGALFSLRVFDRRFSSPEPTLLALNLVFSLRLDA